MIIRSRLIRLSGLLFLFFGVLMMGLAFFLPRLVDVNAYRDEILTSLRSSLHRQVDFRRGEFTWKFGPCFVFEKVTIKEPDGSLDFITADRITVYISLLPLLEKKVVLRDLGLEGAQIRIERNAAGKLNIDDLLTAGTEGYQVQFRGIQAKGCTLHWRDQAIQPAGFSATIHNLSLSLDQLARGKKGRIKLACELPHQGGAAARLNFDGTVKLPGQGESLTATQINANLDLKQADVSTFWPYYGRFIPLYNPGGRLDVSTAYKGSIAEFAAKGRMKLAGSSVVWPSVFHYTVAPTALQIDYDLRLNQRIIDIPSVDITTDGFRIKGSFQMHEYRGADPRIIAKASTPGTFRYEDVRGYVPYGIIEKDAADYIEHKIKAGVFKLDTGTLDGRVSQIAHMEVGQNYNTLYIKGPVEKAVLSYGPKAPEFKNIKGHIELKGKNFNLIGMTGTFGASPFKMNGSITEYNTDKQSDYPVRMEVTPRGSEIAWLANLVGAQKLEFGDNPSSLLLTGSGHHSAYRLNGDWQLKQASYVFPGVIRKQPGQNNHLAFTSVVGHSETKLTSLSYTLPPLSLSATATFRYGGKPFLSFELQTNPFLLGDQLQLLTMWQQYRPRGKVQAHILGNGNPEDFSAMTYAGAITIGGGSFQPGEKLRPVSGINGTITFKGNSLETSSFTARYGSSPVTVSGKIRSLKNPEAEIAVSSPQLFLRDVNLAPATSELAVRRMNASLAIANDSYTIRSLSGLFNNSNFSISGTYTSGRLPEASLAVTSSKLDIDDLILLSKRPVQPGTDKKTAAVASELKLALKLMVEAGRYQQLAFTKLNATLLRDGGIIYLQGLETGLYGGKLSAKGRIAPGGAPENRYDLGFNLERVNAEKFFQALDISREVSGTLNLQGDVTARGTTLNDIKSSALGNIRLRLEKGTVRRFNTLSKVFSILNVSQLLKGKLPDMVSSGMPYNEIKGSFAVKDGKATSQDLFISSDAINISIIGKTDLVKEELDFTIGVQPLQTVDKIINRIPVVGWILTGKGNDFVTVYFEAKGKWDNPKVSAIPVTSLGKSVLNVFRRVFELPVRLFTDTGEVMLGQ